MQCYEYAIVEPEQHPGNATIRQGRTRLPQTIAQRPADRHADRPAKLYFRQIAAEDALIFSRQFGQPFPNRLAPARGSPEPQRDALLLIGHIDFVSNLVRPVKAAGHGPRMASHSDTVTAEAMVPISSVLAAILVPRL